jgi:hypothetical protein
MRDGTLNVGWMKAKNDKWKLIQLNASGGMCWAEELKIQIIEWPFCMAKRFFGHAVCLFVLLRSLIIRSFPREDTHVWILRLSKGIPRILRIKRVSQTQQSDISNNTILHTAYPICCWGLSCGLG